MEHFLGLVFKFLYWVIVYFVFYRPAKVKGRSGIGWFILGLLSFPLPVIVAVSLGNLLHASPETYMRTQWLCDNSHGIGCVVGVACFGALRWLLATLSDK